MPFCSSLIEIHKIFNVDFSLTFYSNEEDTNDSIERIIGTINRYLNCYR